MSRIKTETRTLANGAPGKSLYLLYDPRTGVQLGAESQSEFDGLVELLFDRDVVSVTVQPVQFRILDGAGEFVYTPDAKFVRRNGCIGFREFKFDSTQLSDNERRRYEAAANHIRGLGYEYSIVDACALREGSRLANIKLLMRYAACEQDTALLSWLNDRLSAKPDAYDIGAFRSQAGHDKIPSLYKLLWDQVVATEIEGGPLTDDALLWRAPA